MAEIAWRSGTSRTSRCPNCGCDGEKAEVLTLTGGAAVFSNGDTLTMLHCPRCQTRYGDPLVSVEYSEADGGEWLKYYLENGAALDVMLEPFALLDDRPIRRYLDIGCSFGFVMDYARRTLGWDVRGFDPGVLAREGRKLLGLPIEAAYFTEQSGCEGWADLLYCSEVIEHIPDPHAFLDLICRALSDDGILLLTTPNGDFLRPDAPADTVLMVLCSGFHVVLYNPASIEKLLRDRGFNHVRVEENGFQIRVAASRRPFGQAGGLFSRDKYRSYLESVVADRPAVDPMGAGFAYRLFKEYVNAGSFEQANRVFDLLRQAYQRDYGIDVEAPAAFPFPEGGLSQAQIGERWPFNLCGLWYFRGISCLLKEGRPDLAAQHFNAAKRFGELLRQALNATAHDDAELANLCREAELGLLSALSQSDPDRAVVTFHTLAAADGSGYPQSPHLQRARRRLFTDLVNLGHGAAAEQLIGGTDLPLDRPMHIDGLPTAWACGLYLLNHKSDFEAARQLFADMAEYAKSVGNSEFYWHGRFHEGLTELYLGNKQAAARIAAGMSAPVPNVTPAPEAYLSRLAELTPAEQGK